MKNFKKTTIVNSNITVDYESDGRIDLVIDFRTEKRQLFLNSFNETLDRIVSLERLKNPETVLKLSRALFSVIEFFGLEKYNINDSVDPNDIKENEFRLKHTREFSSFGEGPLKTYRLLNGLLTQVSNVNYFLGWERFRFNKNETGYHTFTSFDVTAWNEVKKSYFSLFDRTFGRTATIIEMYNSVISRGSGADLIMDYINRSGLSFKDLINSIDNEFGTDQGNYFALNVGTRLSKKILECVVANYGFFDSEDLEIFIKEDFHIEILKRLPTSGTPVFENALNFIIDSEKFLLKQDGGFRETVSDSDLEDKFLKQVGLTLRSAIEASGVLEDEKYSSVRIVKFIKRFFGNRGFAAITAHLNEVENGPL